MRAVLDPNVLISAVLSREGAPAEVLRAWRDGEFELVVSAELLDELARALSYPELRERITEDEATALVEVLSRHAKIVTDPDRPSSLKSPDPGDDYLLALIEAERAALVTGDGHLLPLGGKAPILTPAAFLDLLRGRDS